MNFTRQQPEIRAAQAGQLYLLDLLLIGRQGG
jgi:hypothetical protein